MEFGVNSDCKQTARNEDKETTSILGSNDGKIHNFVSIKLVKMFRLPFNNDINESGNIVLL